MSLEDLPGTPESRSSSGDGAGGGSRSSKRHAERGDRDRRRQRRRRVALAVLAVCAVLFGASAVLVGGQVRSLVASVTDSGDYEGAGSGAVTVTIPAGASGRTIASVLAEAGVVKTPGAFVAAAADEPRASSIQPGTYELRQEMSGAAAIAMLLDPEARTSFRVQVPEGYTASQIYQRLSEATGLPASDYEGAAQDPQLGLPADAQGAVEGYLFPATYTFDPGTTALEQMQAMVQRTQRAMDDVGFPADPAERHRLMTEASLVQKEGANAEDMAKVARVIENRVAAGQPLQFDTTVNYATGKTGLTTTAEDRANTSPYNTYLYPGLPPGPISSPGEDAMRAALQPAAGDWLYFVVTDPSTGETKFAATYAEHQRNVAEFQAWLRANPQG
ncbi:endolytic transglycosylase MltG [Quadrisphaera sp. KR29]|uniref:endolytic transglycosylase MltG n=1 Tax=Quadrisphaera sp. KR29 TaxID=3461391 RepID=UPI0040444F19